MNVVIETTVNMPLSKTWHAWVTPEDIKCWNFANDDWCCPNAEIDFKEGGQFNYRMAAKDNSMAFDFSGEFSKIIAFEAINFTLNDGRTVSVEFIETDNGTTVKETFQTEDESTLEQQKQGWKMILNNFKKHVENK
ncbi:SRPBCC domain-containing protein [Thalassotalea hakodatensis]|uniref:SRPBCC domain-containing protein n=1 Tax=Thalassotalea hakodatensis TaxID=3030492 RepID=UPI002572CEF7|nr:SRPBCC domain-containing protein [Thalassotalea hakodatensis]